MNRGTRALPPKLALFFACIPLFGWWMTGLFDLDEGFYGAVVAEMNRRHEWITPYFNGQPWFEKPILLYWLAKPCMMLFGMDLGPRLPSVICTVALFAICGWFMKRRYEDDKAQASTVFCLGTSILVIALGRLMMTDAPLNLCLTVAFLSFFESLVGDRRWRLLTAFCLGLGVLAKGPVAIILFVGVAAIALWRIPSLRTQIKGYWLAGTAILLATVATWYVPCYLANGQVFVQKFLIEQNIGRFLGGDKAHSLGIVGLPFYIPILLIAVFPWGWIERKAFTKANCDEAFSQFLAVWAIVIFAFFTVSSAKLPHYVLPVLPPLAMLAGKRMSQEPRIRWQPEYMMGLSIIFLLLVDPLIRIWYVKSGQAEAQALVRKHPEIEVLYQLGKQEKTLNTGTTKLQETSLPSLIMYLNKPVVETDDPAALTSAEYYSATGKPMDSLPPVIKPLVFFTRCSRISNLKVDIIEETENFGVYKLKL